MILGGRFFPETRYHSGTSRNHWSRSSEWARGPRSVLGGTASGTIGRSRLGWPLAGRRDQESGGRFDECVFKFGAYVKISIDIKGSKLTGKVSKIVSDTSRKRAGIIFRYRIKGSIDATGRFNAAGGKVKLNGAFSEDGETGKGTWELPACRGTFKFGRKY